MGRERVIGRIEKDVCFLEDLVNIERKVNPY